ncbi:histone-lysine N-methyltransferase SUVR5 isoform X2 [Ananas comosus]|uniref:Histone-lysine N-methyltransferase SUVR5 isoform X2 n=1 Tax=Ananas comosus TaxID=4615 RepID=A0A6P5EEQ9_ANACO|nr:histone-lysine N-methyltransferase SUVR5 isoform X2 [Ananas comosus]
MPVLSLSDVQLTGEQNPGEKPEEDMLDDPSLLQVECPQQRTIEKLSLSLCDRNHILLEVDYAQPLPSYDLSRGGKCDRLEELNSSPQGYKHEMLDESHATETSLSYREFLLPTKPDEHPSTDHEGKASFERTEPQPDSYEALVCNLRKEPNLPNERNNKEEVLNLQKGSHCLSDSQCNELGSCNQQEIGVKEVNILCNLNDNGISYAQEEEGCMHSDTSTSEGQNENRLCTTLHDLSDLACRADLDQDLFFQQKKDKLILPGNSTGPLFRKVNCNADNSYREGGNVDRAIALWIKWRGKWQTGHIPGWIWNLCFQLRSYPNLLLMGTTAVFENARKAATWKEFALEASRCRGYTDLGKMLIKLQNMVLPGYINCHWRQGSSESWAQRCQNAQNAESIEILTEEFVQSILWKKVDELWNAPVQSEFGSEWKTWKHEMMKWYFTTHPTTGTDVENMKNGDNTVGVEPSVSRKRPKLEIRRAESSVSQVRDFAFRNLPQVNSVDTVSGNSDLKVISESVLKCVPCKVKTVGPFGAAASHNIFDQLYKGGYQEKGENVVPTLEISRSTESATGGILDSSQVRSDNIPKYRQCSAFVEAKGRQCGRWANDGDVYCCVHLGVHSGEKLHQEERMLPVEAPMCEGTTTHGSKCKHRARYGSQFCKKHRSQTSHDSMVAGKILSSSESMLKREDDENKAVEKFSSSNSLHTEDLGLSGNIQASTQEILIPVAVGETLDERNCLMKKSELHNALPAPGKSNTLPAPGKTGCLDSPRCIGHCHEKNGEECQEDAKRHTLYCEKHLPKFLKRARNGKSRLISKDVFLNLLKSCSSRKQKINLHQACDFLYWFMKGNLSRQQSISKGDNMGWLLAEASKDLAVGEFLLKLVSAEREKLARVWGFGSDKYKHMSVATKEVPTVVHQGRHDPVFGLKCKICAQEFCDDQSLGLHWTDVHKKEARWLFRGYACAVCLDSFTNRKVLETHVQERHGVQFLQHSTLLRCMSCSSHFVSPEQLWQHVLSSHAMEFRLSEFSQQSHCQVVQSTMETSNKNSHLDHTSEKDDSQKYTCRFCGLRFDLLPDLGRHHQVAHMRPDSISHFPPRRGNYQFNRSKHYYPNFKRKFRPSMRFKKSSSIEIQKHFKSSKSVLPMIPKPQSQTLRKVGLGRLSEFHCSDVAQTLFSKIKKSKPHPSNLEIVSIARSCCCRMSLHSALEVKYGLLPENLYLRAAKLCSELNVQIEWHQEGFICPQGCKPPKKQHILDPLEPLLDGYLEIQSPTMDPPSDASSEADEYYCVLDSKHFNWKPKQDVVVLCADVSFGREKVPISCVVDNDIKDSFGIHSDAIQHGNSMPWQCFTYVTERLTEPSLDIETKNSQLGCGCSHARCHPEKCDHVYLFDNDYESAEDIHGQSMRGRFAYDERGRIILEEGYMVYECNSSCKCNAYCQNRVLQKGVQLKLEIFRTGKKGWAVRAGETISRGTFVCEYIGEILNDDETIRRRERYGNEGCSYLYEMEAYIDGSKGASEGAVSYAIDATYYGNVSRFINHSCSPNLVNYLVLVESMDCQLAHIGFYASRDISIGEELAYDYRHKLLPGDGHPCHCGAPNCRGRLF